MKARVTVTLKSGVLDPQGKAIEGALASLGLQGVTSVRQGKLFDVEVAAADEAAAGALLRRACERLLANTVIENYRFEIDGGAARQPEPVAPATADAFTPDEPVEPQGTTDEPDPDKATQEAAEDAAMPVEGHP